MSRGTWLAGRCRAMTRKSCNSSWLSLPGRTASSLVPPNMGFMISRGVAIRHHRWGRKRERAISIGALRIPLSGQLPLAPLARSTILWRPHRFPPDSSFFKSAHAWYLSPLPQQASQTPCVMACPPAPPRQIVVFPYQTPPDPVHSKHSRPGSIFLHSNIRALIGFSSVIASPQSDSADSPANSETPLQSWHSVYHVRDSNS